MGEVVATDTDTDTEGTGEWERSQRKGHYILLVDTFPPGGSLRAFEQVMCCGLRETVRARVCWGDWFRRLQDGKSLA